MLDAAKNKIRVKVSYLMIALTVAGCVYMVIEGKKVRVGSSVSPRPPQRWGKVVIGMSICSENGNTS